MKINVVFSNLYKMKIKINTSTSSRFYFWISFRILLYRQRSLAKVLSFAVKALMDESKENIGMCNSMRNMTNILRIFTFLNLFHEKKHVKRGKYKRQHEKWGKSLSYSTGLRAIISLSLTKKYISYTEGKTQNNSRLLGPLGFCDYF